MIHLSQLVAKVTNMWVQSSTICVFGASLGTRCSVMEPSLLFVPTKTFLAEAGHRSIGVVRPQDRRYVNATTELRRSVCQWLVCVCLSAKLKMLRGV